MKKQDRAALFRERAREAMAASHFTQARLADAARVDRSTVSALLGASQPRLPNAQVVAELAAALGVSADWLLGLSETRASIGEILSRSLEVQAASRDPVDDQIERWHDQARGTKIRNVPSSLPAVAKTEAVLRVEYADGDRRAATAAPAGVSGELPAAGSADQADIARRVVGSDLELCLPYQRLEALAAREGLWRALDREQAEEQIERLATLHTTLYPRVRIYLYDAAQHYSAPITVFGEQRAVVYLGRSYFAFTTQQHIVELTAQFDLLVRDATVEACDFATWLAALKRR